MKYLPPEITEKIIDNVAKYDDYLSRRDLRNLRLVNKHFSHFATPPLFQAVPFWLGLSSLEHLTLISEHPQISKHVTKLVFSPLRFVKWKDPYSYQSSVRSRFERDTFSHNVFSLSFGKHVAAYKGYVEAQDYLSKKSQDTKILLRALRHLPQLKNVTVVFRNEVIGAREIMSAFGLLNGNEVTLDSEYTLPVLIEALSESDKKLDKFNLVCEESTSFELFCRSRSTFNYNHEPRFKYVSEPPTNVTAKAFWNAFHGDGGTIRRKVITLMCRLREFKMSGLKIDSNDVVGFHQWSHALEPIVAFSHRLEELIICPSVSGTLGGNDQRLHLSSILHTSSSFGHLQHLTLEHVESHESLLVELFTKCCCSLVYVLLLYVRITGSGSWSDVFRKARNAEFKALDDFVLLHCGETEGVVRAQNYLKRITDKNPIDECNENQNDDSD